MQFIPTTRNTFEHDRLLRRSGVDIDIVAADFFFLLDVVQPKKLQCGRSFAALLLNILFWLHKKKFYIIRKMKSGWNLRKMYSTN